MNLSFLAPNEQCPDDVIGWVTKKISVQQFLNVCQGDVKVLGIWETPSQTHRVCLQNPEQILLSKLALS